MRKNILVTGVSRGVGLEIVRQLLNKQYNVYGISRTFTKEIKQLQEEFPNNLFFKSVDLSDVENLKDEIFKNFIPNKISLHGFVNNAAMAYDDIITNLNLEKLDKMFKVNVYSPMMITKSVIRNMLFNKVQGAIVHISSISVHTGYKGLAMYAGSKGALEGFSKNTAREWGQLGLRSNTIVAGFMDTQMSSSLSEDQKRRIHLRTSMKKPTEIESVAATTCFLLSQEAKSITGQNIHVDSGTI